MSINQRIATGAAVAVITVAALAGCHGNTTTGASTVPSLRAVATSTAAVQTEKDLKAISAKCGTDHAAGQITAAKELLGGKDSRAKLWDKCGVPKAKRSVVENQALDAAEKAHLVHGGHDARVIYFTKTLPHIILENQA
jgi:hypothetical protein